MIKRICDICNKQLTQNFYQAYSTSVDIDDPNKLWKSISPVIEFCDLCLGRIKDLTELEKSNK